MISEDLLDGYLHYWQPPSDDEEVIRVSEEFATAIDENDISRQADLTCGRVRMRNRQ